MPSTLMRWIAVTAGLALFAWLLRSGPPEGLSAAGWTVLCVGLLMTVFWFTEAIPVTLTATLPFVLFPLLEVRTSAQVAGSYFSPVLFLVLGGFFLALAMEKWGLHRRVALLAVSRAGGGPRAILFAVMSATAFVSIFVSNSAATLAMLPVALAVVTATDRAEADPASAPEHARFGRAMVLGVAWGATLGGFGTIIGSPGNAAAVAIYQKVYGAEISFVQWAAFGLPIVILGTPLAWFVLSRVAFPFRLAGLDGASVKAAVGDPGRWTAADVRLLVILGAALSAWVAMPVLSDLVPGFSDSHAALLAAFALFLVPAGGGERKGETLLRWDDTKAAPWHLLVLVGGGLALAEAINATDLSPWLREQFDGALGLPPFLQLAVLILATLIVTEFVTNAATVAAFLPATVALAGGGALEPVVLGMAVALAANWGFLMPAGTPSLALAYGTGRLTTAQMAGAGAAMDVAGVFLILAVVLAVGAFV